MPSVGAISASGWRASRDAWNRQPRDRRVDRSCRRPPNSSFSPASMRSPGGKSKCLSRSKRPSPPRAGTKAASRSRHSAQSATHNSSTFTPAGSRGAQPLPPARRGRERHPKHLGNAQPDVRDHRVPRFRGQHLCVRFRSTPTLIFRDQISRIDRIAIAVDARDRIVQLFACIAA